MQKLSMLASVVSSLILASTGLSAFAQGATVESTPQGSGDGARGEHRHHERGGGERGGRFQAIKGSLSAEQQQQIDAIKASTKEQVAPVKTKLEALRAQIENAAPGTNVDELKGQAQQLREQLRASMKGAHEKMLGVLTPEQKATLAANKGGGRAGRGGHGGRGAGAGGGSCAAGGSCEKGGAGGEESKGE
jgi:Spy/CpxP family protein refolding chaperone